MPGPEPLSGHNLAFVELLYADYLENPMSVSPDWRAYFAPLSGSGLTPVDLRGPQITPAPLFAVQSGGVDDVAVLQDRLDQLVRAYRVRGHMIADLDPLGLPRDSHPELDPSYYGFTDADLNRQFSARTLSGPNTLTLSQILGRLKRTYCGNIGVQFMHIDDLVLKSWLQTRIERTQNQIELTREQTVRVLTKLTDAEIFEQFIHKKFLGAKRFSLEGGESLIPLIDMALERAGAYGIEEAVIAMAHRGRLNVLANVMDKSPAKIFREFADRDPDLYFGGGDVKYHMGYSSDHTTQAGQTVHLSLCFNPSHLEFVNPVLLGRVRSKQDRRGDTDRKKVLPILIHGDAAFAGQGIVQETLNLSELVGYSVGGTIHIIVNNQVGFTTPPKSSRSTSYASDVAKMLEIPILHVNGEHPEAVAQAVSLAMDFRQEFNKDVVIDMWCYRRYGHNEGDDPSFTQPLMYATINALPTVRQAYLANLMKSGGDVSQAEADEIAVRRRERLDQALSESISPDFAVTKDSGKGLWEGYLGGADLVVTDVNTAVDKGTLSSLLHRQTELPDTFTPHKKIRRLLDQRAQMSRGERDLDWGGGEALAFASLLAEGVPIRVSGQDSGRGTFSHRHAVLHDQTDASLYIPLQHLAEEQGAFEVIDSPLSEAGVLGFEYGYSLDAPDGLCIWEAQFGDFVNSAQVIIDQFIVSSEDKWSRLSGLVMLLPHGFEGQGPEHSSARLERFLAACAEDNITVCNLTTPAQLFHCFRRQIHRKIRKPLVIMTPKSLLRHPEAVSTLEEFSEGGFQRLIKDPRANDFTELERVILCTGKIYYELDYARQIIGATDVAIHRVEQLYPLRESDLTTLLADVPDGTPVMWVQDEPANQGAWPYLRYRFGETLLGRFPLANISRPPSASPATGSAASHRMEHELLIERAFGLA